MSTADCDVARIAFCSESSADNQSDVGSEGGLERPNVPVPKCEVCSLPWRKYCTKNYASELTSRLKQVNFRSTLKHQDIKFPFVLTFFVRKTRQNIIGEMRDAMLETIAGLAA